MKTAGMFSVILAGGSGVRFWPLSREQWPKQFLKMTGKKSLIAETFDRAKKIAGAGRVYVVANAELLEKIRLELLPESIHAVTEPLPKNTAPALALAAKKIAERSPEAIMVALPSDHVILDHAHFLKNIRAAAALANRGYLVTLGMKPTRPETGFGYIKAGQKLAGGGFRVARFTEKPSLENARRFLKAGTYFWNSGMFVWKARVFLEEVKKYMPDLHAVVESGSRADPERWGAAFERLKSISVDYAILEKSRHVAAVPCSFRWSDVGSWSALDEFLKKDGDGNVFQGNVLAADCKNSIIFTHDNLVAALGLENMVVVDTEDAVLAMPKDRAQDVRKIVEVLRGKKARESLEHRTNFRPWGSYTVLLERPGFKIKKVDVLPGKRLSLQLHNRRSEHWVVVHGKALVTRGLREYVVRTGESTFIPEHTKHRLENPGKEPLGIIEVQCGEYVGEDDIVRYSDDFGRGK